MNRALVNFLRCPNCKNNISIDEVYKETGDEILSGSLCCVSCRLSYRIIEGIPILLPSQSSNLREMEFRDRISKMASGRSVEELKSIYDTHHFRRLAQLHIESSLSDIPRNTRPAVLDIGIGWGLIYLPFLSRINLFGLDYSFESLLLLKSIYEQEKKAAPVLICASLSAIPIKDFKFDLIWSRQVYQHIPDIKEVKGSWHYLTKCLLNDKGRFIIDNLNFYHFCLLSRIKSIIRKDKIRNTFCQERHSDNFYIRYYSEKDFISLLNVSKDEVFSRITFTETLFHPEFYFVPRSNLFAVADTLLQRMPFAKFLGRQISITIERR